MMLWLILTFMTWVAAVWLALAFIRRSDHPNEEVASDIAVYRDQLQEIERDVRSGLIDDAQAETARIEIKRRILAADCSRTAAMPGLSGRERSFALIGSTGILVLGSAILYAVTGNPELASTRPSTAAVRDSAARQGTVGFPRHPSLDAFEAADRMPDSEREPQTGLPTVEEMTRRLAARLARDPGDTEGWRTLGWSYLNIGQFREAADAYAKAVELDPNNTGLRGGRIEALVGSADGVVTAEVKAAIRDTLRLDPKDARARYFDGLAREQEGDKAAALAQWTELLKEGSSDESWASDLRNRVSTLKQDMGLDGEAVAAGRKPAIAERSPGLTTGQAALQAARAAEKRPSPQDMQAAEAMLPGDRVAMIRGMVDGLASRLERAPRDAEGWIRLIRSRIVLGEGELAKQALERGLAAFADDAPERDRIAAAAQQLGVSH